MKKFFSLIAAATLALTAMATDYTGTLAVTVNGEGGSMPNTKISMTDNGNSSYTLSINNFMLGEGAPVGNIVVTTNGTDYNGATMLKTSQNITITDGDPELSPFWMGPSLGEVPINMTALFKDGAMYTNIDIYMANLNQIINVVFKSDKGFTAENALGETEGYQLPGSGFEEWAVAKTVSSTNKWYEPRHWHSFGTASTDGVSGFIATIIKSALSNAVEESASARPGSTGTKSARLFSSNPMGSIIANGTFTTGRMNAGSTTANDASGNYAYLDMSKTDTDQNGDKYGLSYTKKADALKVWVKFSQGSSPNAEHPYASVSAIITDGTYYQDPEANYTKWKNGATKFQNKVATAKNNTIPVSADWQELTIPFDYDSYRSDNISPKAALITITTNADPGQGTKNDEMFVDDLSLVYYGDVTNITVNGLDDFEFDAATHNYAVEAAGEFTENDVVVTKTGEASYLLKSVNAIDGGYVITVTVIPNDMSKAEVYTINVTTPAPAPAPLYVLGEVNGNNWDYNVGAEMTYNAETEQYELDVHAGLTENSKWAYFSLTKGFGADWNETNALRLGGVADANTEFVITADNQNLITLAAFDTATDGTGKTFAIPAGQYKLIVDKAMTTLKVEGDIVVPSQELYVIGSFNGWDINNPTALSHDGDIYTVTLDLDKDAEFKFVGQTGTWDGVNLGANADGDTFWVTPEVHESLVLTDSGKNFQVKKAGTWTLTVDLENKLLTVDGDWSTPLAETLQGENVIDRYALIGSDMAVVLKCDAYAILSDGNNWLKVQDFSGNEGDVVTNVAGYIEGLDLNPVMTVSGFDQSKAIVDAEPTKMDFAYATYDTMKQLKSNQVIELVGYYKDGYIYQAAKGYGMHIAVSTDNMSGNFAEGEQQHFTGVVNFKQAWTPANAPARVSQDSDDAYTNITFDVTEAGTVTGVNTVKAFNGKDVEAVYNVNGQRVATMGKGVYILRHTDGTTTKVLR